ncbi:MAG: hypothetical protein QOF76_2705 [Solirubrobacteraceae bacterium]|jgi:uncharacterized membrane protein YdjX (TVP38/TMEM64 family)|nr:hypothetical protein [Solirubrobacteraceae bacterium]
MRRLALLTVFLVALLAVFYVAPPFSKDELRDLVEPAGAFAAPLFVVVSGVLGALLVPGPLLAGASGLLFGTWSGFFVTLGASVLSALIARAVGARAARRSAVTEHPAAETIRRHSLFSVVLQRLAPLLPDGPFNYGFGVAGVAASPLVLGTLIGSSPRAFAYTALGDSVDDPTSPLALIAVGVVVLTGAVGLALAARVRRAS